MTYYYDHREEIEDRRNQEDALVEKLQKDHLYSPRREIAKTLT